MFQLRDLKAGESFPKISSVIKIIVWGFPSAISSSENILPKDQEVGKSRSTSVFFFVTVVYSRVFTVLFIFR